MEQFKIKQNEIDEKLDSFELSDKEKHTVQEYISRSILVNYFLIPIKGINKEHIIYTPLDNDRYDINISTTYHSIELKERTSVYDGRLIIEEDKLINLFFQRRPLYINYCLDNNKVYVFELNKIDFKKYPVEILKCNKNTTISKTNKVDKLVRYLPIEEATEYSVPNIKQIIDIKYKHINYLAKDTINKILKK